LFLTELGFGAAPLGNLYREVSRDDSYAAVDAAWDAGMRYFDTAPFYGFGLSERRIGNIVRYRPRDEFLVSTKVGRLLRPLPSHRGSAERYGFCSPMPFEPEYDYTYDGVMRSFEDSQQRLGLASIDILLVHDIGEVTHGPDNAKHFSDLANGGYKALDELRSSGLVKAIGLGVNEWEVCEDAMGIGRWDCFLLAGRYTLLEQGALATFMPLCKAHGASLIIGGAYNSGILATGARKGGELYYNYAPPPQEIIDRVIAIENLCDDHGVTLAAAALQFPLAHELVSTVIPGVGSARRVGQTMDIFNEVIPASFWSDLKASGLLLEEVPTP
jgi:D-threo-aldose 1-dehydrogenase